MKALSLLQPWATLIAIGAKRIETRSWSTGHRLGAIAIHSSKGWPRWAKDFCTEDRFLQILRAAGYGNEYGQIKGSAFPLGAIIAVANISRCSRIYESRSNIPSDEQELAFGDYSAGRFMWSLSDIRQLSEPIPCRGALGLWTVPADVETEIVRQLPEAVEL